MQPMCHKYAMALTAAVLAFVGIFSNAIADGKTIQVLCSTFPIYQITRNITHGSDSAHVSLMIPSQLGCPHDYILTPQDMQKLAKADVLVINGLGMEEFLGAPLEKANPRLKVIDSSHGIEQALAFSEETAHGSPDAAQPEGHHHHPIDESGHDRAGHHPQGMNPHLFASPRMVALLATTIAAELSKSVPAGAAVYLANAHAYAEKMNRLADDFVALGRRLKNNRIVTQHGVFDYLARDMGLVIVAVVQAHAGQEPSAAEMMAIIKTAKQQKAGAIFTEPQYPEKFGRTIAGEAGIATTTLDPVATGPDTAPMDYFENSMRQNLVTLEKTLGTR